MLAIAAAGGVGFAIAAWRASGRLADPPEASMRVNVSGRSVPAVLGEPLAAGALGALALIAVAGWFGWDDASTGRTGIAAALAIVAMAGAGAADDRRGDESSRGFSGHLRALAAGKVTGGIVKIAAGGVAAVAIAVILFPGSVAAVVATVLLVALGANTINLLDRAPGRAAKVFLVAALPLMALGDPRWAVAAAGAVGALVACLPFDLKEKAMLGDAGSNPLGALVGVGLAVSLPSAARWTAVVLLIALNLASERWSFSRAIQRTPWLDRLDRIGRK